MDKLVLAAAREAWQPIHLLGFQHPRARRHHGVVILFVTGFIASNYLGRSCCDWARRSWSTSRWCARCIPTAKQISDTMFSNKGKSFRKVVLIRYPHKDTWSLAFQTSDSLGELNVKLPSTWSAYSCPPRPIPPLAS